MALSPWHSLCTLSEDTLRVLAPSLRRHSPRAGALSPWLSRAGTLCVLSPWHTLCGILSEGTLSAGTLPLRIWMKQWHNGYQQRSARGTSSLGASAGRLKRWGVGFYRWHSLSDGTLCTGTLSAGTLSAGTLPAGTPSAGTLSAGTLSAGTLSAGTLSAGTLSDGTLSAVAVSLLRIMIFTPVIISYTYLT